MELSLQNDLFVGKLENAELTKPIRSVDLSKLKSFENTLSTDDSHSIDRSQTLEDWINSLEQVKTILENDITKENLDIYKNSLKNFLSYYTSNDLYLKEHSIREGYHTKKLHVLKAVDEKVDTLTDKLVDSQLGRLEILKATGQIQGLLFELTL